MKIRSLVILLFAALTECSSGVSQRFHASEQMHFSAEDEGVQKPVAIPDDVLAILSKAELVQDQLENENQPTGKLPVSWFSASAIHLSSPSEKDLIVIAEGPLAGGNVDTFWIFCATPHGYELVLTAPAHDLIVTRARWKGHREIEMSGETAVEFSSVLFRWDGRKYAAYREKSEHIR